MNATLIPNIRIFSGKPYQHPVTGCGSVRISLSTPVALKFSDVIDFFGLSWYCVLAGSAQPRRLLWPGVLPVWSSRQQQQHGASSPHPQPAPHLRNPILPRLLNRPANPSSRGGTSRCFSLNHSFNSSVVDVIFLLLQLILLEEAAFFPCSKTRKEYKSNCICVCWPVHRGGLAALYAV